MENFYKLAKKIVWLICITGFPLIFFDLGTSIWVKVIFFWIGVFSLISFIFDHFKKGTPTLSYDRSSANLNYKIDLLIEPAWEVILGKLLNDNKDLYKKAIGEIDDHSINVRGIWKKTFHFVIFHFESGVEQTWSDYHHTFIDYPGSSCDHPESSDSLYEDGDGCTTPSSLKGYKDWEGGRILFGPELLSFLGKMNPTGKSKEEYPAWIPYDKILDFFFKIYKNHAEDGNGHISTIKKFPHALQHELNKYNIKYWTDGRKYTGGSDLVKKGNKWLEENDIEIFDDFALRHWFAKIDPVSKKEIFSIGIIITDLNQSN